MNANQVQLPVSNFFIQLDEVLDYIPIVSTVSNCLHIITKIALWALAELCPPAYEYIENSPSIRHIERKLFTILYMIPILNIFLAYVRDVGRENTQKIENMQKKEYESAKQLREHAQEMINKINTWGLKLKSEMEGERSKILTKEMAKELNGLKFEYHLLTSSLEHEIKEYTERLENIGNGRNKLGITEDEYVNNTRACIKTFEALASSMKKSWDLIQGYLHPS